MQSVPPGLVFSLNNAADLNSPAPSGIRPAAQQCKRIEVVLKTNRSANARRSIVINTN